MLLDLSEHIIVLAAGNADMMTSNFNKTIRKKNNVFQHPGFSRLFNLSYLET